MATIYRRSEEYVIVRRVCPWVVGRIEDENKV